MSNISQHWGRQIAIYFILYFIFLLGFNSICENDMRMAAFLSLGSIDFIAVSSVLLALRKISNKETIDTEFIKSKMREGKFPQKKTIDNLSPLIIAVRDNQFGVAEDLLESGANPNEKLSTGDHWTALMFAIQGKDLDLVSLIVEMGADIEEPDMYGNTPLLKASMEKVGLEICQFLISLGADVNAKNHEDITALMVAAQWDCPETVLLLIENGADKNAKDLSGMTALSYATKFESTAARKAILNSEKLIEANRKDEKEKDKRRFWGSLMVSILIISFNLFIFTGSWVIDNLWLGLPLLATAGVISYFVVTKIDTFVKEHR